MSQRRSAIAAAGSFVALAIVAMLLALPTASAATYTNTGRNYQFDYPDSWTSGPSPGTDASYNGSEVDGVSPTVVADSGNEPQAEDSAAWLLDEANASLAALNASVNLTIIQEPRVFSPSSARLAVDFIVQRNDSGTDILQREIRFVSDFHNTWYTLTLTDNVSTYPSHNAEWLEIVDSFRITGEPEIPAFLAITVNGNQSATHVDANVSVRFAMNQTVPAGLGLEWFLNGTSVGTGDHVDLTFGDGQSVISVKVFNRTESRTLTKTLTTGTQVAPPPPAPYSSDYSYVATVGLIAALLLVAGAVYYFMVVRPKKEQARPPPRQPPMD